VRLGSKSFWEHIKAKLLAVKGEKIPKNPIKKKNSEAFFPWQRG
jgi:hypothetical protein